MVTVKERDKWNLRYANRLPPLLFVPSYLSSLIRATYKWDRIVVIIASVCVCVCACVCVCG